MKKEKEFKIKLQEIERKYQTQLEQAWSKREQSSFSQSKKSAFSIEILPDDTILSQSFSLRPNTQQAVEALEPPSPFYKSMNMNNKNFDSVSQISAISKGSIIK